jgi:signal transduction histidine kinase
MVSLLISAASMLILALFVLLKAPRKKINRTFAFYSFCIVLWGFGQAWYITFESVFGAIMFHSGAIFISSAFVHFVYTLLKLDKIKNRVVIFLYIGSFMFMLADLVTLNVQGNVSNLVHLRPPLLIAMLIFWSGSLLFAFVLLFKAYGRSTGLRNKQLKFLLTGSLIGYAGGGTNLLPALDPALFQINPFATYTVPVYTGIVAYAIYRYRLMGINMPLKRGMVYSFSAGLLMGLFVVLVLTITDALSVYTRVDSFEVSLFSAVIIAFLFNPLRHRIQVLIDRIFYKKTYNYYSTLKKVSSGLSSKFDLQEISDFIGNEVCNVLGLRDMYVLSYVTGTGYRVISHTSMKSDLKNGHYGNSNNASNNLELEQSLDIVRYHLNAKDIIIKDELSGHERDTGPELVNSINRSFDLFNAKVMVPVLLENSPSLLLMIGEKMSCDIFTSEDISLLGTISEQMAIAVKHAELYRDKIHSERLASIGMMSATFAHEIRNPLTSLKTFAQLMPEKYNDREFRNTFSKIVEGEIEKIDGLINDLLDFSIHKKATRMNNFNLVSLLDETVDYVKGKAPYSKGSITVKKKYSEREILVTGDSSKLNQAFVNILTNGYQAMNGEGLLTVDINPNGHNAEIIITDTGEGIEPESISKIFDPFITTKEMGVGLGLAISKRIIEDHKGALHVESAVSKGTSFTITLPVQNGT